MPQARPLNSSLAPAPLPFATAQASAAPLAHVIPARIAQYIRHHAFSFQLFSIGQHNFSKAYLEPVIDNLLGAKLFGEIPGRHHASERRVSYDYGFPRLLEVPGENLSSAPRTAVH